MKSKFYFLLQVYCMTRKNRDEIAKDGQVAFLFCCAGLSRQAQFELLPVKVSRNLMLVLAELSFRILITKSMLILWEQ